MALGLPNVNISFRTAAANFSARSGRGSVGLILREANESTRGAFTIKRADEIPTGFDEKNRKYIQRAFEGYVTPPTKVVVFAIADKAENLAQALSFFETMDVDYICGPHSCTSTEGLEIATWVKQRRADGFTNKAVLPNTASDSYAVINFTTEDIEVFGESEKLTTAEFCSRIAGVIAGTPLSIACTYAPLAEVTNFKKLTKKDITSAIGKGELVLYHDGEKAMIARGVNSYQTIAPNTNETFKKIKIVSAVDAIRKDIERITKSSYIGKFPNSFDDKCLLIVALKEYFGALEDTRVLQKGTSKVEIDLKGQRLWLSDNGIDDTNMSEQEIKEYPTGDSVYLCISVKILDAMENINIEVNI